MVELQVYESEAAFAKKSACFVKRVESASAISFDHQTVIKAMKSLYGYSSIIVFINF